MNVIGTAGHVDHGKTTLIQALTGMDADRLPEEKARGMTTDLGIAWYESSAGSPVGVVDVPGHERYLRNMVAGAWGLDLALLVVAADDGWMPQTGLHAAIASSLGVPGAILVMTKTDLVPPERADALAPVLDARLRRFFPKGAPLVRVCAHTGQGIPELKAAIDEALAALPPRSFDDGRAFLYVDRSFTPRTGGTVVTGTLRGGSLRPGDTAILWPEAEEIRIKGVQNYRSSRDSAEPGSRAALALPSRKGGYARGQLLAARGAEPLSGREFLVRLQELPADLAEARPGKERRALRPGLETELALGSAKADARVWPLPGGRFARLSAAEPLACPRGFPFVLLRKGGAELLARGSVIAEAIPGSGLPRARLAAALDEADLAATALVAAGYPGGAAPALAFATGAFMTGYQKIPQGRASGALRAAAGPAGLCVTGAWVLPLRLAETVRAAFAREAAKPGGLGHALARSLAKTAVPELPSEAADAIAADMEREGTLRKQDGGWALPCAPGDASPIGAAAPACAAVRGVPAPALASAQALPPPLAALEARLRAAGKDGLEPGKSAPQADAKTLKELCSLKAAVPLDGGIFLARGVYDALVAAILKGRSPGERFAVPEAKERVGLSRKYMLPLLNRMEGDGWVKRWNDERLVLKLPG